VVGETLKRAGRAAAGVGGAGHGASRPKNARGTLRLVPAPHTAGVDVKRTLWISQCNVTEGRIAGLRGQPFVGPVSAPKRAFTLSEARRPATRSCHAERQGPHGAPPRVIAIRVANGSQGG
jgi:hypothetical protein